MAEKIDIDNLLILDGKATAYFEDFLSSIIDELETDGVRVSAESNLTTSYQTVYTAPTVSESAEILSGVVANPTGGAITYTVNVVPNNGSTSSDNEYITDESVATVKNDDLTGIVGMILEPGDFIRAKASAVGMNLKLGIKEIL